MGVDRRDVVLCVSEALGDQEAIRSSLPQVRRVQVTKAVQAHSGQSLASGDLLKQSRRILWHDFRTVFSSEDPSCVDPEFASREAVGIL
jgi:hypothetical protein